MKARILITTAVALGLAGAAHAAAPDNKDVTHRNCFLSRDWDSWRGADPNTMYLRVRTRDFFRLDLSAGSPMVVDQSNHLVSVLRGSSWICGPLDFDLRISDGHITVPLIVKAMTKLTPEEVAAIPKKAMP